MRTLGSRTTGAKQDNRAIKKKMTGRAGGALERDRRGVQKWSWKKRSEKGAWSDSASDVHSRPPPASRRRRHGDSSLPPPACPAAPRIPAPCCRTRRWQARWCSCLRTNPPPNCQPAGGPTSAGRPWPLWSIGAASPQRRPARATARHTVRLWLYAVRDSLRMRRLPAGLPSPAVPACHRRDRHAPTPPRGVPEHGGHAHPGRDLTGRGGGEGRAQG